MDITEGTESAYTKLRKAGLRCVQFHLKDRDANKLHAAARLRGYSKLGEYLLLTVDADLAREGIVIEVPDTEEGA